MPMGKLSQALHPLPYPDSIDPHKDWQAQIYNAWWNGYVLGYPEYFIDSYCESFHNGLSIDEKRNQIALAKRDVKKHISDLDLSDTSLMTSGDLDRSFNSLYKYNPSIRMGMESPISEELFQTIASFVKIN